MKYSIGLIWLFTISGIIGITLGYEEWFLPKTPLHLSIFLGLIFYHHYKDKSFIWWLSITFVIGFLVEYLGVNHGLIFGDYKYGENLGWKYKGVPIMIGVNWMLLTYCSIGISHNLINKLFNNNKKTKKLLITGSLISASLMTALDIIIEPIAPRLDFWKFTLEIAPLSNYIGWLMVSLIIHLMIWNQTSYKCNKTLAYHLYVSLTIFFLGCYFL